MSTRRSSPSFAAHLPLTRAAVEYADGLHAGQRRSDGRPFIEHPLEVASLLHAAGAPDHVVAAGVMHDLIEKTDANASDLQRRFGQRVTNLVLAVSDDGDISGYARRKAALRRQVAGAGDEALALFAADKVSKVRELAREAAGPNGRMRQIRARRLKHYHRSLALLEERLPDSPLVQDLRDELRAATGRHAVLVS